MPAIALTKTPHDKDETVNGLHYKIGAHGFTFRWSLMLGWVRSTQTIRAAKNGKTDKEAPSITKQREQTVAKLRQKQARQQEAAA